MAETVGKLHVLVGNNGYPVLMLNAENDFDTASIFYWVPNVAVGDRVLIGPDLDNAWTYRVLTRVPENRNFGPPGFRSDLKLMSKGKGLVGALLP